MSEAMFFVSLSINMHISEQILININIKRFGTYNLSYRDIIWLIAFNLCPDPNNMNSVFDLLRVRLLAIKPPSYEYVLDVRLVHYITSHWWRHFVSCSVYLISLVMPLFGLIIRYEVTSPVTWYIVHQPCATSHYYGQKFRAHCLQKSSGNVSHLREQYIISPSTVLLLWGKNNRKDH